MDDKKVVLIDADLRRPSQHKLLGIKSGPGLTEVLMGSHDPEETLCATGIDGVRVLLSGSPTDRAPELLGSGRLARLLAELEQICNIIIIDMSPVLAVCDAAIVGAQVVNVLQVVRQGETKTKNVHQTLKILSRARAKMLGTALTFVPMLLNFYYDKYYVPSDREDEESVDRNMSA